MKYLCLSLLTLVSNMHYVAASNSPENELSATEKRCYEWYVQKQKELQISPYKMLSSEDQAVFNNRVSFNDDPGAVTRSRHHFAEAFFDLARQAHITLECDVETLKNTFLKMSKAMHQKTIENPTTELETRMWAFSKKLTPEEQATWTEENYLKNPLEAERNVIKFTNFVAEKLAELKLIENTEKAKAQKAQEIYDEKMALFKLTYKKNK